MTVTETLTEMLDCRADDIWEIRRKLSADRHGRINAVIVVPSAADAVSAVVDHCWHDADVIVADDEALRDAA